uniref:Fungal lipase-like domain-containing protein n=1 Tax=Panagrolaimus superbus TaxID=310955 RepID=A0A914YLX7_9BILA
MTRFLYFIFIFFIFIPNFLCIPIRQSRTAYNEVEARALLNLAAGAYANSPEACIKKTFLSVRPRQLHSSTNQICDEFANSCGSYSLADDINQHLYIVFRGTKSKAQLLTEGWHSLQPSRDFYGIGNANTYFFHALEALWPNVEQALVEYPNYAVTFTGHSLGGALASLASLKTVLFGLRSSNYVKLYTFGQPRVGNILLAQRHNELVPQSYRIVHGVDIVPHLPGCAKDEIMGASSHPCDPDNLERPYHHGIEIYYPHEMREDSPYFECLGAPFGEDYNCSDRLTFIPEHHFQYTYAHRHYFEHKVPPFGKLGCQELKEEEEKLPNNFESNSHEAAGNHRHSTFKSIANKIRFASQFLGIN